MGHLIKINQTNAAGGSIEALDHDTGSPTAIYTDFDCLFATTDFSISSAGVKVFYVKTLADIIVKDIAGAELDRFTSAVRAEAVEIESQSFTGTLPSGSQGVGGVVYEDEVLDRWKDSAGTVDFKVRRTGASTDETLVQAFQAVASANVLYFNVKAYGALGDGATNDYPAFLAAYTAAVAAGGGTIYVPASATPYVLGSTLAITAEGVSILGEGATRSVIRTSISSGYAITINCGVGTFLANTIAKIGITASGSPAIGAVSTTSCDGAVISDCVIDGMAGVSSASIVDCTARTFIQRCTITQANSGTTSNANIVRFNSSAYASSITDCKLVSLNPLSIALIFSTSVQVAVDHCQFDQTAGVSASNVGAVRITSGGSHFKVSCCHFDLPVAASCCIRITTALPFSEELSTCNRAFGTSTYLLISGGSGSFSGTQTRRATRQSTSYRATQAAASTYTPSLDVQTHFLTMTGAFTIGATDTTIEPGATMIFIVHNNTAGNLNLTWASGNGGYNVSATPTSVTAGQRARVEFRWDFNTLNWHALQPVAVFA